MKHIVQWYNSYHTWIQSPKRIWCNDNNNNSQFNYSVMVTFWLVTEESSFKVMPDIEMILQQDEGLHLPLKRSQKWNCALTFCWDSTATRLVLLRSSPFALGLCVAADTDPHCQDTHPSEQLVASSLASTTFNSGSMITADVAEHGRQNTSLLLQ